MTATKTITERDTKAMVSYFRNHPRYGRTTTLVLKATGETLGVFMGDCARKDCWRSYLSMTKS